MGGKGENKEVEVEKIGGEIRFVGEVGNDEFGEMELKKMREFGMDKGRVRVIDEVDKGMEIIKVEEKGKKKIEVCDGENERW